MSRQIPTIKIRQIFILIVIMYILYLIGKELAPYLGGLLGAITLYVLLEPVQKWLEAKKWKPSVASSLLIAFSFVIILLPIVGIGLMMSSKVKTAIDNSTQITETIKSKVAETENLIGVNLSENINT
ncbi:AI-2E family transporter, partial [Nonlabens ulvanivorans]|uniref:AI-2E family transporter n=2 Tax=Nonlabens TaxID=363408 RepID=UPI0032989981